MGAPPSRRPRLLRRPLRPDPAHGRDASEREIDTVRHDLLQHVIAPRDAALVSVLAYEGLRPGEAFALEWADVLDEGGVPREHLRVERALSDHEVALTKSNRGRAPELFAPVADDLTKLYRAVGTPGRHTLVFPDSRGGYLRRQNWRKRAWLPALRRADPCQACQASGSVQASACTSCKGTGAANYFRPYDLRHTAATLLIYAGRTINEVAEHLGHLDPGFTARTYTHIYRDAENRRGVAMEDAIRRARDSLNA